jgi:hypothetical protein
VEYVLELLYCDGIRTCCNGGTNVIMQQMLSYGKNVTNTGASIIIKS